MDPQPTFANWKDRAVYLIAEFKIPLSITVFGVGLWAVWARPEIPSPPSWVGAVVLTWAILSLPTYIAGIKIAKWLHNPPKVKVGIARPGNEVIHKFVEVPPELWRNATKLDESDPLPADEGVDYVITEYEYLEDIGELRIRGCDPSMLDPGDSFSYHERVDRYYEGHMSLRAEYSRLKAITSDLIQDAHDGGLMAGINARDTTLAPDVSAQELLAQVEQSDEFQDPEEIMEFEEFLEQEGDPTNGESAPIEAEAEANV